MNDVEKTEQNLILIQFLTSTSNVYVSLLLSCD